MNLSGEVNLPTFSLLLTQSSYMAENLTFFNGWYEIRLPLPPPDIRTI
jgi:hypothetical protein